MGCKGAHHLLAGRARAGCKVDRCPADTLLILPWEIFILLLDYFLHASPRLRPPFLTSNMELSDDDDNAERVAKLQAAAEPGAKKKRASSSKKALAHNSQL